MQIFSHKELRCQIRDIMFIFVKVIVCALIRTNISKQCHKYSVPLFSFRCTLVMGQVNRTSTCRFQILTPHCSSDGNRWLGYSIFLMALYICCSLHVKLYCCKIFNLSADIVYRIKFYSCKRERERGTPARPDLVYRNCCTRNIIRLL